MSQKLNNKVVIATKWSGATEIATKLVSPISTVVLARLLTPDAFGILVTANMVISFADIFTDAGFQIYIIQHEFKDDSDKYQSIAEYKDSAAAFKSASILMLMFDVVPAI